jgi:hypothetical protein
MLKEGLLYESLTEEVQEMKKQHDATSYGGSAMGLMKNRVTSHG